MQSARPVQDSSASASANRKESESIGTETAGSFAPRVIVTGDGLLSHGDAAFACGAAPPGVFQASDLPDDERASAGFEAVATAFAGGEVELCITGSGSPW